MIHFLYDGTPLFSIDLTSLFLGMMLLEVWYRFAGWRRRRRSNVAVVE